MSQPAVAAHLMLGPREWCKTAQVLRNTSPYWSQVFDIGDELQRLAIEQFKLWHMIPIFETSGQDNIVKRQNTNYPLNLTFSLDWHPSLTKNTIPCPSRRVSKRPKKTGKQLN